MNTLPIIIPSLATLGYFLLIICIRFLDVFEREPYKVIFTNFIFGILGYMIAALIYSPLISLFNLSNFDLPNLKLLIYFSVILSSLILLIFQIITALISRNIFKKEFDTAPDYIIYFATIGIGFNFAEMFLYHFLSRTNINFLSEFSNNLFFSSFFTGGTLPFLMAGIGMAFYLNQLSKSKKNLILKRISNYIILIAILFQIIFYTGSYFLMISNSPHSLTSSNIFLANAIKDFANSISQLFLLISLGLAVIFDGYIISNFVLDLIKSSNFSEKKIKDLSSFNNPFSYIINKNFREVLGLKPVSNNLQKKYKSFAKLALKSFNDNKNKSIYISEALSLFD